jgi:hypothetical protein
MFLFYFIEIIFPRRNMRRAFAVGSEFTHRAGKAFFYDDTRAKIMERHRLAEFVSHHTLRRRECRKPNSPNEVIRTMERKREIQCVK